MASLMDQIKAAQEAAKANASSQTAPASPAESTQASAPATQQMRVPNPAPTEVLASDVKQKYSIYLTDAQREFMENYWHANRHKKQTPGKPKKKINYSDIIAEALELLAEKNGFTI
ncbi:MAG: hypothetical protein II038_14115 [Lachnospiraceae bacterium]|nr:hypothetical protein [Lachnospiraceae bacterium]